MDYIRSMAESNSFDHLIDEVAQPLWIDANSVLLKNLKQVFLNVLKN
jgi:hypothetical protein